MRSQKVKNHPFWKFYKIRWNLIKSGGWHFSFLMTPEDVQKKIKSFAHGEFNKDDIVNEKNIKSKKLKLIKGDTKNISQIFSAIKECDMVVHLAEMVGDPLCEQKPDKTFEINFLASISIANICKNLEISKFIYLSSCSVYGENKDDKLLTENSKINPS